MASVWATGAWRAHRRRRGADRADEGARRGDVQAFLVDPLVTAAIEASLGLTGPGNFVRAAQAAVERVTGEAPLGVVPLQRGHPSARKFRVELESGERYFVKAIHRGASPVAARLLRREIAINWQLPDAVLAPRLEAALEEGPWVVAVFEYVDHEARDSRVWPP